jgi:hypothetical protein
MKTAASIFRRAVPMFKSPIYEKFSAYPDGKILEEVMKLVAEGLIIPILDKTFLLEELQEAHNYVEQGHCRGKVIIIINHDHVLTRLHDKPHSAPSVSFPPKLFQPEHSD